MKKLISTVLALVMVLAGMLGMFAFPAGAQTITPDTSWYDESEDTFELSDAADFLGFIKLLNGDRGATSTVSFDGKTIKLTADIDLNPGWDAEAYFNNLTDGDDGTDAVAPTNVITGYRDPNVGGAAKNNLALFYGTFDGQGHVISGVYWNEPTADMGLFGAAFESGADIGQTSTVIKNVAFVNSYMNLSQHRQGAIIGMVRNDTTIENVYNGMFMHSDSTGTAEACSAFAGYAGCHDETTYGSSITIRDCVMDGTFLVENGKPVVGFVLGLDKSENVFEILLEDCLMSGEIKAPATKQGNIAGFYHKNKSAITMTNCVMAGTIPSYAYAFGYDNRTGCTVTPSRCAYIDGTNEELVNPIITDNNNTPIELNASKVTSDALKIASTTGWTQTLAGGEIYMPISAALAKSVRTVNAAAVATPTTSYIGYQTKTNGSSKSVRLVGLASIQNTELEDYEAFGFKVVGYYEGDTTSAVNSFSKEKTTVYTSIIAAGGEWSEQGTVSGNYIFVQEITGIDASKTVVLEVTTFYVDSTGEHVENTTTVVLDPAS